MLYSENIKFTPKGVEFSDKNGNPLNFNEASRRILNRFHNWWLDFELFLIHSVSILVPFASVRHFVFKLAGVRIGKGSTIHMGCRFFEPKGVNIGEDTKIGDNTFLDGRAPLTIGNHVDIASQVLIYNSEHDLESDEFEAREEKVEIGDYCFIGPRVIILPGVRVGKGAVLAAGAVVTEDVDDFTIVGGVPAKLIAKRKNKNLHYRLGRARLFQ